MRHHLDVTSDDERKHCAWLWAVYSASIDAEHSEPARLERLGLVARDVTELGEELRRVAAGPVQPLHFLVSSGHAHVHIPG